MIASFPADRKGLAAGTGFSVCASEELKTINKREGDWGERFAGSTARLLFFFRGDQPFIGVKLGENTRRRGSAAHSKERIERGFEAITRRRGRPRKTK